MTKNVNITMDIKVARMMLGVAGFSPKVTENSTDDEIFAKVLSLIECYGATINTIDTEE